MEGHRDAMTMALPFTHDAFLDVFGQYNTTLWPVVLILWLATTWVAWQWIRQGEVSGLLLFGLLAAHWAWSGLVYHGIYFRPINPAATLFAVAFIVEAVLLVWLAATSRGRVVAGAKPRRMIGGVLIAYGLVYPFVGVAFGLSYPRLPLFAVPCPTTLVTAGWLIAVARVPRTASLVPMLWAVVGSSAALTLGIRADLALLVAASLLLLDVLAPSALGRRAEPALKG